MTDFNKIKKMVDDYEVHLGYLNAMYEAEGNTKRVQISGEDLDKKFSAIVDEVAIPFHNLIRGFANVGIDIKNIDAVEEYKEPYHSIFMRIGHSQITFMGGCANKHFKVEGYPYRSSRK